MTVGPALPSLALLDGLLEAVFVVQGSDGRLLWANAEAARMVGLPLETVVGRVITEYFRAPEDACFWSEVRSGSQASLRSLTRVDRPDGAVRHVDRQVHPGTWALPASDSARPDASATAPEQTWIISAVDVTERRNTEDELEQVAAELRATLESTADGVLVCSLEGAIRAFNRRFAQLWNIPKEMLLRRDDAAVHARLAASVDDPVAYASRLEAIFAQPEAEATDVLVLRSGRLLQRISLPQVSRGRVMGRVFSFHDITVQTETADGLRIAAKVFDASPDAVFIADAEHRIVSVNPACSKLARAGAGSLTGTSAIDLFQDRDAGRLFTEVQRCWASVGVWEGEVWHRRVDGSVCPVRLSWVILRDTKADSAQSIGFYRDLSGQRAAQQRIEELAYSDVVTGLPNRLLLARRVSHVLRDQAGTVTPFAVLFLDLDRFKNINDALGHHFGDRVLVKVAERIKSCLRLADTLCRLGGDEFVVHLHDADAPSAEGVAQRILESLGQPITLDGMRFSFSCSIGLALFPQDGETLDDLVRHADTAMFRVKEHGRGSYRFYQPHMNVNLLARVKMEHALRDAVERNQLRLHYQPQINIATGEIVGAEALLRWTDPELGPVSPGVFIPLAEESGAIVRIGAWVLEEGVRQAGLWLQAGTPLPVSVNVSPLQFRQADFVDRVAAAIRISGLPPHLLELELTESILLQEADEALQRLRALATLGVRLAIDDFGTGYSSLSYLKKFPIHRLKIDQSFVRGLPDDASDRAIVRVMTSLGEALGFDVVAEGVETLAQRDCLISLACPLFQGFLCAPGMPADELTKRLSMSPFFSDPAPTAA
jgi:diguanylate cyclase (GGDEF)-like protein/PAS domain S-box-containing protein